MVTGHVPRSRSPYCRVIKPSMMKPLSPINEIRNPLLFVHMCQLYRTNKTFIVCERFIRGD